MIDRLALAPAKRSQRGGAMMTMMCCTLHLVEEERRQRCCHPKGVKDDKDSVRGHTSCRAEERVAVTMDDRSMTEKD